MMLVRFGCHPGLLFLGLLLTANPLSSAPADGQHFVLGSATLSGLPALLSNPSPGASLLLRVFELENGRSLFIGQSTAMKTWTKRPERQVTFPPLVLRPGTFYVVRLFATSADGEQMIDETSPFALNDQPSRIDVPFTHGGGVLLPVVGAGLSSGPIASKDRFVLSGAKVAGLPPMGELSSEAALYFRIVAFEGSGVTRTVTVGQSKTIPRWKSLAEIPVQFADLVLRPRVFYVVQSYIRDSAGDHLVDATRPFELRAEPGVVILSFPRGGSINLSIAGAGLVGSSVKAVQLSSMPVSP